MDFFEVNLSDDNTAYYDGDTINGRLDLMFKKTMDVKSIQIKFCGIASVSWSEKGGDETIHYSQTQKLFKETIIVCGEGAEKRSSRSTMQGRHSFPFSYKLPLPLPSSYRDTIACVKYYIRGMIVCPLKNIKTKKKFTVTHSLDLSTSYGVLLPSTASKTINLCCLWCKNGPVIGNIEVERSGYALGETIFANATVDNNSSSKVRSTSIELVRHIYYYAGGSSRMEKKSMVKHIGPPCRSKEEVSLTNAKLVVPRHLHPTDLSSCKVMTIRYSVMIHGHMRLCAIDLRGHADVIIGTIPFESQLFDSPPYKPRGNAYTGHVKTSRIHARPGPSRSDRNAYGETSRIQCREAPYGCEGNAYRVPIETSRIPQRRPPSGSANFAYREEMEAPEMHGRAVPYGAGGNAYRKQIETSRIHSKAAPYSRGENAYREQIETSRKYSGPPSYRNEPVGAANRKRVEIPMMPIVGATSAPYFEQRPERY